MTGLSGSGMKFYFVDGSRVFTSEPRWDGQKNLGHSWLGGITASGMRMQTDPVPWFSNEKLSKDWSKPLNNYNDCPTDEIGCELNLATYCAMNKTGSWNKMIAEGFKPRPAIDLRQGDPQIHILLGMDEGKKSGYDKNWAIDDQPHREKLRALSDWYKNRQAGQ